MNQILKFATAIIVVSLFAGCGEKSEKSPPVAADGAASTNNTQAAEPYPGYSELKMKADKGDVSAMYAMGTKAVTSEDAFLWFNKAAENGDAPSQFFVGRMYLNGVSVPANKEKAIEWYKKSAAQGNQNAKNALKTLK